MFRILARAALAGSVLALLAACGGGGGGDAGGGDGIDPPGPTASPFTDRAVSVNPTDPRVYSLAVESGETVDFLAQRDASGIPTVIKMIDYANADGERFQIALDAFGLPVRAVDEDGRVLELTYLDDNDQPIALPAEAAASSTVSKQGTATRIAGISAQISAPDDDQSGAVTQSAARFRLTQPTTVSLAPPSLVAIQPQGNIDVLVSKCGTPINPSGDVFVRYTDNSAFGTRRYPAFPTSQPGRFVANIPTRQPVDVPDALESVCSGFANTLGNFCAVFDAGLAQGAAGSMSDPAFQTALCTALGVAVAPVATPAAAAAAGASCRAMLVGATRACGTLGLSADPTPDGNSVLQALCGGEEALRAVDSAVGIDQVTLQAVADFQTGAALVAAGSADPGIAASTERVVSAAGPFSDLIVDSLTPSVDALVTDPAPPVLGSPYIARADLSCVLGAQLDLSVDSDGDVIAFENVFGASDQQSISVEVPAAADPETVDRLRVSAVNDALAQSVIRTRFVRFDPGEEDPGGGGGGGGGSGGPISSANMSLRLLAEGDVFLPSPGTETRTITVIGADLLPLGNFDCVPTTAVPALFYNFQQNTVPGSDADVRALLGNIRAADCAQLPDVTLVSTNPAFEANIELAGIPLDNLFGADSFQQASAVRFSLDGEAVCSALRNFDYRALNLAGDTLFQAQRLSCDASSALDITFFRELDPP